MRVYIAGRVSGLPMGEVFAKFGAAAYRLKQQGYEVVNPVSLCSGSWSWKKCMRVCLAAMLKCDAIYLLPDWNDSAGARLEYGVAMEIGMKIVNS